MVSLSYIFSCQGEASDDTSTAENSGAAVVDTDIVEEASAAVSSRKDESTSKTSESSNSKTATSGSISKASESTPKSRDSSIKWPTENTESQGSKPEEILRELEEMRQDRRRNDEASTSTASTKSSGFPKQRPSQMKVSNAESFIQAIEEREDGEVSTGKTQNRWRSALSAIIGRRGQRKADQSDKKTDESKPPVPEPAEASDNGMVNTSRAEEEPSNEIEQKTNDVVQDDKNNRDSEDKEEKVTVEGLTEEFAALVTTLTMDGDTMAKETEKAAQKETPRKNSAIRGFVRTYLVHLAANEDKPSEDTKTIAGNSAASKKAEATRNKRGLMKSVRSVLSMRSRSLKKKKLVDQEITLTESERKERGKKLALALRAHFAAKAAREMEAKQATKDTIVDTEVEDEDGLAVVFKEFTSDFSGVFNDKENGMSAMFHEISQEVAQLSSPETKAYLMAMIALLFVDLPTKAMATCGQDVTKELETMTMPSGMEIIPTEKDTSDGDHDDNDIGLSAFLKDLALQVSELSNSEAKNYMMAIFSMLLVDMPSSALASGKAALTTGQESITTFHRDMTKFDNEVGMSACMSEWKDMIIINQSEQ